MRITTLNSFYNTQSLKQNTGKNTNFGKISEYAKLELVRSYRNGKISTKEIEAAAKVIEQDKSGNIAEVMYNDVYPAETNYPYKVMPLIDFPSTDYFKSFVSAAEYANLFAEAVRAKSAETKESCIEKMTDLYIENGKLDSAYHTTKAAYYGDTHDREALKEQIAGDIEFTQDELLDKKTAS